MRPYLQLNKLLTRAYREDEGDAMPVCPVAVNPEFIRCVTPRRDNKPGARLTFSDGGGYAVRESYDAVMNYIENGVVPHPMPAPTLADEASGNA